MEFNGTFLATIVTFLVFVYLMNKILYQPVLAIMAERKSYIDENYKTADDNNIKIQSLSQERESLLSNAKDTAKSQYNDALNEYKSKKAEFINDAQNEAKENFERSNADLENISNEVKDALKGSMTDLANDIVEKVIGYRSEVQGFDNEAVSKVLWDK